MSEDSFFVVAVFIPSLSTCASPDAELAGTARDEADDSGRATPISSSATNATPLSCPVAPLKAAARTRTRWLITYLNFEAGVRCRQPPFAIVEAVKAQRGGLT
jgi:hypothetical protein